MVGLKKYLSFAVVLILVSGGFTVFGTRSVEGEEGEPIDSVEIEVTLQMESGVGAVYEGELDLFLNPISGRRFRQLPKEWRIELGTWESRRSRKNLFINPAHEGHGTEAMEEAVEKGWIDEPEEVQWLANNVEGYWTVNPFAHEDIRFAMQYLNRKEIIDEMVSGVADPRYSFMDTRSEVWRDHFVEAIEEEYDMSAEGNEELMEQLIEESMEEIKENVAFGEVRWEDGYWQYRAPGEDWHTIEVKLIGRVEDWRLDLAYHMVDILQEIGFNAYCDPTDSATAIPLVFFGDPEPYDNLAYHIYTGGWISTQAAYYQEAGVSQMHAPWYGFTQTYVEEERWNYDEEGYTERVQRLDSISKELFQGQIETKEEYWEKKVEATQLGFEEALRVFLVTYHYFYVYNPDTLLGSVSESINGYDTYFSPRTMLTDDGTLEAAIPTGLGRPYMDNWNIHGGSRDIYGEYQRRMAREYNAWNHPQSGIPMPVNNYWMDQETFEEEWSERTYPYEEFEGEGPLQGGVEYDFEYDEGELIENITIPDDAVDYFPEDQEWKTVDDYIDPENRTAAVKVTFDVHEEHEWHDGTGFDVQDLMWNYARVKRLGTNTSHDDIYFSTTCDANTPWWDSIHALEFNREEGTYTVYGNYTFPVEPKVGEHYSIDVETNQWTYEGWDFLHETSGYDYAGRAGQEWIHQLSPSQMEDLIDELEHMLDRGYLPEYLDADNMPDHMEDFAMDMTEVETQISSVIDFIGEYEHAFIGMGPFVIEEYDTEDHSMSLESFDNYGYPYGYWEEQFRVQRTVLDSITAPRELELGETFDMESEGHWRKDYPPPQEEEPLTEEHLEDYRFVIYDEREPILTVNSEDIELSPQENHTEFEVSDVVADVDRGGKYRLQFEVMEKGGFDHVTIGQEITLYHPDVDLTVPSFDIPEEVTYGEEAEIWIEVENQGEEDTVDVLAEHEDSGIIEEIASEEIPAGDMIEIDVEHVFDEMGHYDIGLRDGEDRFVDDLGQVLNTDVVANDLSVTPTFGANPLDIAIEARAANNGMTPRDIDLEIVDEEEHVVQSWTYSLKGYESLTIRESYTLEPGDYQTYEVILRDLSEEVEVTILGDAEVDAPEEVVIEGEETREIGNMVSRSSLSETEVDGLPIVFKISSTSHPRSLSKITSPSYSIMNTR